MRLSIGNLPEHDYRVYGLDRNGVTVSVIFVPGRYQDGTLAVGVAQVDTEKGTCQPLGRLTMSIPPFKFLIRNEPSASFIRTDDALGADAARIAEMVGVRLTKRMPSGRIAEVGAIVGSQMFPAYIFDVNNFYNELGEGLEGD